MSNHGLIRLKNSSRANQLDCVISYFFQLHLMLHACVQKFDVTDTVRNFLGTKQGLSYNNWSIPSRIILLKDYYHSRNVTQLCCSIYGIDISSTTIYLFVDKSMNLTRHISYQLIILRSGDTYTHTPNFAWQLDVATCKSFLRCRSDPFFFKFLWI